MSRLSSPFTRVRNRAWAAIPFLGLLVLPTTANRPTGASERDPASLTARIPERAPDAPGGNVVAARIRSLKGRARDEAVLREIQNGNVPPFLRELKPVHLTGRGPSGRFHEAVILVTPDYLSVGSDEDFVRVPLGLDAALAVGNQFGFALPTRKMVDTIYLQATLRLAPKPMTPGAQMTSTAYFVEHNRIIERQRQGQPLDKLVSGHKKDLVLTKRLLSRRGRVAIYGWHRGAGRPIQPLSTVHGARYADYSHGVRLVSTTIVVDGELRSLFDALADPELAPVLTYEGVIRDLARLVGSRSRATI